MRAPAATRRPPQNHYQEQQYCCTVARIYKNAFTLLLLGLVVNRATLRTDYVLV